MPRPYAMQRRWFFGVFVCTLLVFLLLLLLAGPLMIVKSPVSTPQTQGSPSRAPASSADWLAVAALGVSLVTCMTGLAAFLLTLVLGIRKERRETRAEAEAMAMQALELEKLRGEIAALNATSRSKRTEKRS